MQGIDPNGFDRLRVLMIAVGFPAPLGVAHPNPFGRPVIGTSKAIPVHKRPS